MQLNDLYESYAWMDDVGYPLDPDHPFVWRQRKDTQPYVNGTTDSLYLWCEEHDVMVSDKPIDPSSEKKDRDEWISDRRTALEETCLRKTGRLRQMQPGTPGSFNATPPRGRVVKTF